MVVFVIFLLLFAVIGFIVTVHWLLDKFHLLPKKRLKLTWTTREEQSVDVSDQVDEVISTYTK